MKLTFLGVTSAFAVGEQQFQSNMLIVNGSGTKMLVDCGSDARHSLHAQGYTYTDIDSVYVSHLHSDHIGGLEWLGFCKRFIDNQKPALYISPDQREKLWNNVLSGGMSSLEEEKATLSTYFDVQAINNNSFIWQDCLFQLIKTYHAVCDGEILPSYGLLITGEVCKIFISTDTRFSPDSLQPIYNEADVIFHDCETSVSKSGQHSHYNDLKTLDSNIKQKMWLYGYNSGLLPDAKKDGFQGFVTRGQVFDF